MNVSFNKTGIITSDIFEKLRNPFDPTVYYEPDGSAWIRVTHQNNPATNLFSSTDTFITSVYKDDNRWFYLSLCDLVSTWELMVKQMQTSGGTEEKYRWIQSVNPMEAVFADVASENVTKITTSGYTSSTYGGAYKKKSNAYIACNNGNSGNWWGAIGSWSTHQSGIPGYNGKVITSGYLDVYLRINGDIKTYFEIENFSIYKDSITSDTIIER